MKSKKNKTFQMKTPVEFFLSLIPNHTHPHYELMVSYPFVLTVVLLNCMYFSGFFFDFGDQPITLAKSTYEVAQLSKQIIIS